MGNGVFDVGKSTAGFYGAKTLGSTDSLSIMLLTSTVTDTILGAYTTFAAILAAQTEATFTNYVRIQVTANNVVSIAAHVVTFDITVDPTWTTAGGATNNNLTRFIIGYKPTSGSADSAIIPLGYYDFVGTTDGSNLTAQINALGLMSWT